MKNKSRTPNTRYQILYTNASTVENFAANEKAKYVARQAELRAAGVMFTIWDCYNNSLSKMFSI